MFRSLSQKQNLEFIHTSPYSAVCQQVSQHYNLHHCQLQDQDQDSNSNDVYDCNKIPYTAALLELYFRYIHGL